jgi:hypothetical protein
VFVTPGLLALNFHSNSEKPHAKKANRLQAIGHRRQKSRLQVIG